MSVVTTIEVVNQTVATAQEFMITTVNTGFTVVAGGAGSFYYKHDQSSSLSVWVINHNLNSEPNITVYSVGGVRVDAEIIHMSANQAQAIFDFPYSGFAICS
jgi:hypothetical protein